MNLSNHATDRILGTAGRVIVLFLVAATGAGAQTFSIDWSSIDGGGGTSTGGVYQVSGTIGQSDAGPKMSGGNYTVAGGFWSLIAAVQTPGAPLLTITLTTTNTAVISWPAPATGFVLEQSPQLDTPVWSDPGLTPTNNGTLRSVIVPAGAGNKFYRLRKP